MGGRLVYRIALMAVLLGVLVPAGFGGEEAATGRRSRRQRRADARAARTAAEAGEESPETEMEAALEAARRANVDLPSDLQLKYIWSLPLGRHIVDKKYLWIIKDYVVAVSRSKLLHLIRKADGVAVWTMELGSMPMYKPVITKKAVYLVVENYVVCIDLREGQIIWRIEPPFAISAAPVVHEPDFYIAGWDKKLHAFELRVRERVWYQGRGEEDALKGTHHYLFPSWHLTTKGHIVGNPQEFSGFIYFPSEDGQLYSISRDGDLRYKAPTQKPIKATPTIKEDKAFVGSTDFSLYCFNRLTGGEMWHFPTGADVLKKPYVDKRSGVVYCPSNRNGIFGIDERTGLKAWQIEDAEEILGVSKEVVYLGLRRGRMLAVSKKSGVALWISLLKGVRYYVENHNDWSRLGSPDPMQVFLMLKGNVLCCLEDLGVETAPVKKAKKVAANP